MKKYIYITISVILLLALLGVVGINTYKLQNSEWVCIAQECKTFLKGDDWIKQNCIHDGTEMLCSFEYDGDNFIIPLSGVNLSNMISCGEYQCASNVLVSYPK